MPGSDGSIAQRGSSPGIEVESLQTAEPVEMEWLEEGRRRASVTLAASRIRRLATRLRPMAAPREWTYVVLHHSATAGGSVDSIDAEHRQRVDRAGRAWDGIGYHFVVGNGDGMPDGRVEPTFRWMEQIHGAHAGNEKYNTHGIGICLIGNFDREHPTERQVAATRQLIEQLSADWQIPPERIVGHGELRSTNCPGRKFPWHEIVAGKPATEQASDPLLWQLGAQSQTDLATRGPWR